MRLRVAFAAGMNFGGFEAWMMCFFVGQDVETVAKGSRGGGGEFGCENEMGSGDSSLTEEDELDGDGESCLEKILGGLES
jgi:hypothetical protein